MGKYEDGGVNCFGPNFSIQNKSGKKPKVSVILPVYNGRQYLASCLESLRAQTIREFEVICIDDGSDDGSARILDAYKSKYPECFKVFHKENSGVFKAREFGLKQARGEYVAFCDCDDTVDAYMYEKLYRCAIKASAEISICGFERVDACSGKVLCKEMNRFGNKILIVEGNEDWLTIINTALWNKLIKKEIAEKHICFEVPPRVAEDMMFLLSIYPHVKRIAFCPQILYRYYIHIGSAMSKVKVGEVEHLEKCMLQLKKCIHQKKGRTWDDILSIFAFIHFGVAFIIKVSEKGILEVRALQKRMVNWLDHYFKSWDRNPYLNFIYVVKGHSYLLKPMLVLYIYRLGAFPVFLEIYLWLTKKLKIDVKW